MRFTADLGDGRSIEFECADTLISRWVCQEILEDKTYPYLPFVDDVRLIFDVGANCGAATVHLARHYPDARVHAFEPGSEPRAYLERNASGYPNVSVHPIGLSSSDQEVPLYRGREDTGNASVFLRPANVEDAELVRLRSAGDWATENGVERIDILKLDAEGCEVDVLSSLGRLLPSVKVIYVEYDSREDRREIERLVGSTHELYSGLMFLDQGECVYLRKDLADLAPASEHLRKMFEARSH